MNKQSISFKADEQKLTKTGGIEHYASNIVAYIEATFDLGTNWNGYDSVRAVWSNDYLTDISTVLDPDGKCTVPTEVLADTGNVTVNLVGSIADGDTLTDRLTTYPCKAVIVDADAKVEGEETESITPSQFEQFVEIVHDEVEQVTGMTAEAETLPAGSDATASYNDGVLSFGIPRGDKGEQGETGETGDPAGFGDVTASVDNSVGTPSVVVTASGPNTAKDLDFAFHNLKGDKGDTGDTGETGATGNGIANTVLNPDYTLTITFTDGTSYTTPSIRGAKGDTGDTGATGNGIQSTVLNADYTLTITFTDGTSYTTPSIRGEQGPVGPVSDVTVNGTSVVDQNGVAAITMPELVKTVQGNPIVIDDAFGPVKNLTVELLPIQAGTGTPSPQNIRPITGHDYTVFTDTGKNLLDIAGVTLKKWRLNSNTFYTVADSSPNIVVSVTDDTVSCQTTVAYFGFGFEISAVDYARTVSVTNYGTAGISSVSLFSSYTDGATRVLNGQTITIPANTGGFVAFRVDGVRTFTTQIQVEYGNTASTYAPYHGQSKTVTLPHTVYGAGVGVTSGTGKEKMGYVDMSALSWTSGSFAGITGWYATAPADIKPTTNSVAFSGIMSKYTAVRFNAISQTVGTIALRDTGILYANTAESPTGDMVYELATPTDLSTTPTDLTLYNGDNVVSSDGDMTMDYVQDMAIAIRKIENQL